MVARERGETRLKHIAGNQLPADDELSGKFAWLEDGIDLDRDLRDAFLRLQITLGDMSRASILLVQDPAILTDNTKAIAGLNGAYIMMPSVLTKNSGVCLKIKDAVKTRRRVFLTDAFRTEHPAITAVVAQKACATWKLIDSIDGFAAAKNVAMRGNCSASVVAFIGSEEGHVYESVTHCYGLVELINFLFCVDSAKSALSIFRG